MGNKFKIQIMSALVFGLSASSCFALESTETLPSGINSPALRLGYLSGLGARYTSNGELFSLSALNSLDFNVQKLKGIEPQVAELESALNSFGGNQVGSQLHLGRLSIEAQPQIQYFAPVHAWGLNSVWTFGFGIPVMKYSNKVNVTSFGSNLAAFKKEFGGLSSSLDSAFTKLNVNLNSSLQSELSQKGYAALGDREQTLLGDLNLVNVYQFYNKSDVKAVHKLNVTLPTGTKSNPDDLLSLDLFGDFSFENQFLAQRTLNKGFSILGGFSYKIYLPETLSRRVPKNSEDVLPDLSTKQDVMRTKGSSWTLSSQLGWKIDKAFSVGLGYQYQSKNSDQYAKGQGWLDGLSRNTDQVIQKMMAGLSYSSVQKYFDKESLIPAVFNVDFSDTIAGRNTPRQTLLEFSTLLFY